MNFSKAILGLSLSITVSSSLALSKSFGTYFSEPDGDSTLVSFSSCKALKDHLVKTAQTRVQQPMMEDFGPFGGASRLRGFEAKSESCLNCGAGPGLKSGTAAKSHNSGSFDSLRSEGASSGHVLPSSVVGTNNQVTNVDEADFVKFDGKNIYQIHQGQLKILKAWPANEMILLSSTQLNGTPQELLIHRDNVVVLANSGQKLEASIFDVSNPGAPRELTKFEIPGQYMSARLVGSTLRIVIRDLNHQFWKDTAPAATSNNSWIAEETIPGELQIESTIQTLKSHRKTLNTLRNCENVYAPKLGEVQNLTRLSTIDLDAKIYSETLAFINPSLLYASDSAIYLAAPTTRMEDHINIQKTIIHKFGIKSGDSIQYMATGEVNGQLINQFALDEYKDYLRVATSGLEAVNKNWWRSRRNLSYANVNRVQVLEHTGSQLKIVGKTDNLASGERLYSVRFDEDKGYLVTFRQVDPLFTLDLSSPRHPKAVGELKIPGFSTYIHMLDRTHLLTIGQDADPRTGRPRGVKISVFDTTNFKEPKEVKSLIFKAQTQSEATYEHKAFNFNREKGALAIPVTDGSRSALLIFKVSAGNIEYKGEMIMTDMFASINANSVVRRSFFAEDIVYAIGDIGVKAAKIYSPETTLGSVSFNQKFLSHMEW